MAEQNPSVPPEKVGTPSEKKPRKGWTIAKNVLFYTVISFFLAVAVFGIVNRVNGGTLTFGNDEVRIVLTGSMEKPTYPDTAEGKAEEQADEAKIATYPIGHIKTGSAVVIYKTPTDAAAAQKFYSELAVGDVITFNHAETINGGTQTVLISHRIIGKSQDPSTQIYTFITKGDANGAADSNPPNSDPEYHEIVGKVTKVSYGWGSFLTFLTGKWGILTFVIIPCVLVAGYEIGKIITMLAADRKAKRALAAKNSEDKIAALQAQLAALQSQQDATPKSEPSDPKKEEGGNH
jgi:hypothetical protein